MSAIARFNGVFTPTALPSSTTPPDSQRSSSRFPRARSCAIDEVISDATPSAHSSRCSA
jgi:hypothetical protein